MSCSVLIILTICDHFWNFLVFTTTSCDLHCKNSKFKLFHKVTTCNFQKTLNQYFSNALNGLMIFYLKGLGKQLCTNILLHNITCHLFLCLLVYHIFSSLFEQIDKKIHKKLTIGSYISMHSSRYEAHRKFGEHKRCIRIAQGIAERNSSFLNALQTPKYFISWWTHSWHMNQLFYNIFNPMENCFFLRDLFADIMSMHNGNMKHTHTIEFDYTNLLAMLWRELINFSTN